MLLSVGFVLPKLILKSHVPYGIMYMPYGGYATTVLLV